MKNNIFNITLALISILFFECSSQKYLQKRTNKLIEKSHKEVDTVYLYSVAFNDFNLVWYHKDACIKSYWVKPLCTKKYKPIKSKNSFVTNDSINMYFDDFLFKDLQCFESVLDGAYIKLYIKNKETLFSNIDIDCLFNNKYPIKSFPYKLQYDFSQILKPKNFDIEKIYPETN